MATFMPANRLGSAQGKRIFVSTAQDEALETRASASMSGSTERRPSTVSITIGKMPSISAIAIFGSGPVPIQITNNGASATLGMELSATSSVYTVRSSSREYTIPTENRDRADARQLSDRDR